MCAVYLGWNRLLGCPKYYMKQKLFTVRYKYLNRIIPSSQAAVLHFITYMIKPVLKLG